MTITILVSALFITSLAGNAIQFFLAKREIKNVREHSRNTLQSKQSQFDTHKANFTQNLLEEQTSKKVLEERLGSKIYDLERRLQSDRTKLKNVREERNALNRKVRKLEVVHGSKKKQRGGPSKS